MSDTDNNAMRPWNPGDTVEASRLEAMRAGAVMDIRVSPPLKLLRSGNNVSLSLTRSAAPTGGGSGATIGIARLTGPYTCGGLYTGYLTTPSTATINTSSSTFPTSSVGTDGSAVVLRYILEAGTTAHQLVPGYFHVVDSGQVDTEGTPKKIYDVIGAVLDLGTLQYQVKQMTSNTAVGWNYLRMH